MTGMDFVETVTARIIPINITFDDNSHVMTPMGLFGIGNAHFVFTTCVDSLGNPHAFDYHNNMQKLLSNGTFTLKWESFGTDQFILSTSIAEPDSACNLYMNDSSNTGVEKFIP